MKNMKILTKLILSFTIILSLTLVVGIIGITGMTKISEANTYMYENNTKSLEDIANIIDHLQRIRIQLRNLTWYSGNDEKQNSIKTTINSEIELLSGLMLTYDEKIENNQIQQFFDKAMDLYSNVFMPYVNDIFEGAKAGVSETVLQNLIREKINDTNNMIEYFNKCMTLGIEDTQITVNDNELMTRSLLTVIVITLIISIIVGIMLAYYISGMIIWPLSTMGNFLKRFGTAGDLNLTQEDHKNIKNKSKDEIGQCVSSCAMLYNRMNEIKENLNKVAECDLSINMKPLSDRDSIGLSISKMLNSLNSVIGEIHIGSAQIVSGVKQIAQGTQQMAHGAQDLSSGSNEQSASVQELLSSITQIVEQVNQNTKNAQSSLLNVSMVEDLIEKSMNSMEKMLEAMKAINESSQKITNVINAIDDIASQTNLLSLNAAIEASRAGEAGKGFSVVADEVRKLAIMSAEAAKETAELIQDSLMHISNGNKYVEETKENLEKVRNKATDTAAINQEISESLQNQAKAIQEINKAVEEVSIVVQTNASIAEESAAAAEESAAAAEEISSQANNFNKVVNRFKLL